MARAVDENAHISEESAQLLLSEESGEEERRAWSALGLPALERVWDNDADAVYDDWKEIVMNKSSVEQIRERFDKDVERFSNLETGQSATIDSPLCLELIAGAAASVTPSASSLLDIGCGAGNYALKLLERLPELDVTLVDLSRPMLDRAVERVGSVSSGAIAAIQGDIREIRLEEGSFDIVVAASVLHHLRGDEEWRAVFGKIFDALRAGGSFWVFDLIEHSTAAIQALMRERYGEYLTHLRDAAYREVVFAYIAQEDTPRPLLFQIDLLREVGFREVEILHKNGCFAAFGGVK